MFFSRGKNKIQKPATLTDIYDNYISREECPAKVDRKTFVGVNDMFYKGARDAVLAGKTFFLPFGMGYIQIEKNKASGFGNSRFSNNYIDWKTTLEVGKKVYHLNEHSQGYNYYIRWRRPEQIRHQSMYRFVPTRAFKRTLAKIIKNKESDYYGI